MGLILVGVAVLVFVLLAWAAWWLVAPVLEGFLISYLAGCLVEQVKIPRIAGSTVSALFVLAVGLSPLCLIGLALAMIVGVRKK